MSRRNPSHPAACPPASRCVGLAPSWRVALLCSALALGVAGCGRKGPLEPPPAAATQSKPADQGQAGKNGQDKTGQDKGAQGKSAASKASGSNPGEGSAAQQAAAANGVAGEGDDDQETRNSADGMGQVNTIPNISPIGSGRKGKPILPPHKPFLLDPIL